MLQTGIGYLLYIIFLLILSGAAILFFDTKLFQQADMPKEKKVASALGWINIGLGMLLWLSNWIIGKLI